MAEAMSIKVSTQELRNTAEEITKRRVPNLRAWLDDINREMNNLEQTWTSESSVEIRTKMNAMKSRFDQYDEVIKSYASFLVNAAEMYEDTESQAKTNASKFQ